VKKSVAFLVLCFVMAPVYSAKCEVLTEIMGKGELSAESMYVYLANNDKENGLNPIDSDYARAFVAMTVQEAEAEGVRSDVAFCLMMHETGFLNFGGDVDPSQNNFGGLGATGGGAPGASFENARLGIRGVVQHLKCYATDESLNQPLSDPRWSDALRGRAKYVEWLGYEDNPTQTGWAMPGKGYGERIVSMISEAQSVDTSGVAAFSIAEYDPSQPDPFQSVGKAPEEGQSGENGEEEGPKRFPFSLLELNAKNLINFAAAFLVFLCIVFIGRFRSKYI
jgi:N-acetylmuramoyl-L-alanine amidase